MIKKILKWFDTDPKRRVQEILRNIEEKGLMPDLLEAIDRERKLLTQKGLKIKVRRVV